MQKLAFEWHNIFTYFPIVLFILALLSDLLTYYGKLKKHTLGHIFVIFGLISLVPTISSGLLAQTFIPLDTPFLSEHQSLGFLSAIFTSLYAGLRISIMWWKLILKPLHYVILSALVLALIFWTSDYGWLIELSK